MNKFIKMSIAATALFAVQPAMSFGTSIHVSMAAQVLRDSCGFTPANATAMSGYADDPDSGAFFTSANHFDNCVFYDGQTKINTYLDAAVLDARNYQLTGAVSYRNSAYSNMGWAFHAAQDFYAHSNWVENSNYSVFYLGVNAPASWWRSGVWSLSPTKLCPSGSKDHGPQSADSVPGTTLNKDNSARVGYSEAWSDAYWEVQNQWNRLKSKIISAYGTTNGNIIIAKLQSGT